MQPTRLQRLFRDGMLHLIGIVNDYTDLRHLALHQTTATHVLAAPVRWPEGFSLWRCSHCGEGLDPSDRVSARSDQQLTVWRDGSVPIRLRENHFGLAECRKPAVHDKKRVLSQDAQNVIPARPQGANKDDPSKLARVRYLLDGPDESPTARVQRGSSKAARCASTGDSPGHPIPCWRAFSASC